MNAFCYVRIICENEHTYKLLKEFAKDLGYILDKYKITLTLDEFKNKLNVGTVNIGEIKRNNTNHVELVKVDNKEYTGIEFRKKLNLRSTDFEITINNDEYIFTTYGYGHGVGMSQYGASYLAKQGYNYEEILKYYYGNIEFIKI